MTIRNRQIEVGDLVEPSWKTTIPMIGIVLKEKETNYRISAPRFMVLWNADIGERDEWITDLKKIA